MYYVDKTYSKYGTYRIIAILVIFEEMYWFFIEPHDLHLCFIAAYSAVHGNTRSVFMLRAVAAVRWRRGCGNYQNKRLCCTHLCYLSKTEMRRSDLEERFTTFFFVCFNSRLRRAIHTIEYAVWLCVKQCVGYNKFSIRIIENWKDNTAVSKTTPCTPNLSHTRAHYKIAYRSCDIVVLDRFSSARNSIRVLHTNTFISRFCSNRKHPNSIMIYRNKVSKFRKYTCVQSSE